MIRSPAQRHLRLSRRIDVRLLQASQSVALCRQRAASTNAASHPLARKPQLTTSSSGTSSSSNPNQNRQSWSTATALLLATMTGAAVS